VVKDKETSEPLHCPVGRFFNELEEMFGSKSDTMVHLEQAQLELLKAIRSFVDGRIDRLEKKNNAKSRPKKRATKIKVE
jgi:hypothetical protein